jgi:hypothetical protein
LAESTKHKCINSFKSNRILHSIKELHKYSDSVKFMHSDEKTDFTSDAQGLCGIALTKISLRISWEAEQRSTCGPGEFTACEDVKMQVENTLPCAFAAVGYYTETVLELIVFGSKLGSYFVDVSNNRAVIGGHVLHACYMLLGDSQPMHGSCGSNVGENKDLVVLIYLGRGDIPCDYFAE